MRTLVLFSIVLVSFSILPAEKCAITGYVSDSTNGEPVAGANVFLKGEGIGASTNIHGFFSIPSIPRGGPYSLVVKAIGYREISMQIVCVDGSAKRLDFELAPEAIRGKEVVIEAKKTGGMQDPLVGHAVIESELIRHAPGLAEPDLFRAIQFLPGVQSISDFSSGLYIWGGTPGDNLILLDNIEVYNPTHLMGFFSTFITDAVREVNLVKGGYPARWGGTIGSVLEVTNKDGNRKNFSGMAELSLLSGKTLVEGPVGNGSYMVAGRRTWIDAATKALEKIGITEENLPYYFYDFQGRINQDLSPRDRASFSFYAGDDVFALEEDEDEDNYQPPPDTIDPTPPPSDRDEDFEYRWGNLTLSAQLKHIFNQQLFGHIVLAGSKFRSKLTSDGGDMKLVDRVGDISLKGDMTYFHSDKHTISFGGMLKWRELRNYYEIYEKEWGDYDSLETRHYLWDKYTGASLIALYGEEEYKPNVLWNIQGGLRAEYATNGNYFRIGPRISAQRWIDGETTLRAAYGRYYQYIHLVNPLEDLGIAVFDNWVPIDDEVAPASADHFVIGMDTDHLPLHLSSNAYYKRMSNVIEAREEVVFGSTENITSRFHVGSAWSAGLELTLDGVIGKYAGWLGYSLGWVSRKMPEKNNGKPYAPKYDRRHCVKLALDYKVSERITLSTAFNYGTGQPTNEPIGFTEERWGNDVWYYPIWGDEYHNGRLPDYHRLDISMTWRIHDGNWKLYNYIQILNVYNRKNVIWRDWDEPMFNTREPDDAHMLPFIPSFGFRAEF